MAEKLKLEMSSSSIEQFNKVIATVCLSVIFVMDNITK